MGLERTKKLLQLCGQPDSGMYIIHIAGTNGKGSTSAMLNACLISAGFCTGLYTSPHLHSYRERIQVDGQMISEEDFAGYTARISQVIKTYAEDFLEAPTEFEFLTVLAALYFNDRGVKYAIFETGLGGRLDSTNALITNLSVITAIGLDHQDILGQTITEIASEKAGIIREKGNVVLGMQPYIEAEHIMAEYVLQKQAKLKNTKTITYEVLPAEDVFQIIRINPEQRTIRLKLAGEHQIKNMLNVWAVLDVLSEDTSIDTELFIKGFEKVSWPARLETMVYNGRKFILDVAHNPQGVEALRRYLDQTQHGNVAFLAGFLDEKDKEGMIQAVIGKTSRMIISKPKSHRAQTWNIIPEAFAQNPVISVKEDPEQAFMDIVSQTPQHETIVVFGSFYFVSCIREILLK